MTTFTVETIDSQQTAAISAEVPADQVRDVFDSGLPAIVEAIWLDACLARGFGYHFPQPEQHPADPEDG